MLVKLPVELQLVDFSTWVSSFADKEIEELNELCEDTSENIDVVGRQLLELNKGNLKKTYELEDIQTEYDMLAAQEDGGSMFMTASKSKKSLHNLNNRHNR